MLLLSADGSNTPGTRVVCVEVCEGALAQKRFRGENVSLRIKVVVPHHQVLQLTSDFSSCACIDHALVRKILVFGNSLTGHDYFHIRKIPPGQNQNSIFSAILRAIGTNEGSIESSRQDRSHYVTQKEIVDHQNKSIGNGGQRYTPRNNIPVDLDGPCVSCGEIKTVLLVWKVVQAV